MSEKRILLVDDEDIILDTYSSLLSEKGYTVVTASSGTKALEEFLNQPFDLVVTDLAMTDGDGFGLLEKIKKRYPDTPTIVLTGKRYRIVSEFVSLLGVNALIEKPCSNEIFLSCVRDSLNQS